MAIAKQDAMLGVSAIAPSTKILHPVDVISISNGVFYYVNAIKACRDELPTSIPISWNNDTIFDCNFNTLNGGNLEYNLENINKFLLKRRRVDAPYTEDTWTTLFEIPVEDDVASLNFVVNDFTNICGATYVYQLVPVGIVQRDDITIEVEGIGQDSEEVKSIFDGVFICDANSFIKLIAGVKYGSMQTTQLTGIHQTLGGKYPIIVANSDINYHSGSISGTILNEDYGERIYEQTISGYNKWTGKYYGLDRTKIIDARKRIDKFLTNKKPKILKDENGNAWLIIITEDISYDFFDEWGRGLGDMSANWTEIGDVSSSDDMIRTGILNRGGL